MPKNSSLCTILRTSVDCGGTQEVELFGSSGEKVSIFAIALCVAKQNRDNPLSCTNKEPPGKLRYAVDADANIFSNNLLWHTPTQPSGGIEIPC